MSTKVPAATLVEDFSLYPRNDVNDTHVNELVKALASGATLPPIVVERSSNRIVDGFHRRRAAVKFDGEDAIVEVDFRDYADEAVLYLDSVQLNAQHGKRLDRHDQTRIVLRLQELKVDARTIAMALHVPEQEVRILAVRIVYDTAGTAVPQKRGFEHLRGQTMSDDQIGAMKGVRSGEVGRLVGELVKILENELVDYTDERLEDQLKALAAVVTVCLKRVRAEQKAQMRETAKA